MANGRLALLLAAVNYRSPASQYSGLTKAFTAVIAAPRSETRIGLRAGAMQPPAGGACSVMGAAAGTTSALARSFHASARCRSADMSSALQGLLAHNQLATVRATASFLLLHMLGPDQACRTLCTAGWAGVNGRWAAGCRCKDTF
jgi:hypothetical protein